MGSAAIFVGGGAGGCGWDVAAGAVRGGGAGDGGAGRGAGAACAGRGAGAGGVAGDGGTGRVAIGLGSGAERALSFGGSKTMAMGAGRTSSGGFRQGPSSSGPTISSASSSPWTSAETTAERRNRPGRAVRRGRNSPTKAIGCPVMACVGNWVIGGTSYLCWTVRAKGPLRSLKDEEKRRKAYQRTRAKRLVLLRKLFAAMCRTADRRRVIHVPAWTIASALMRQRHVAERL